MGFKFSVSNLNPTFYPTMQNPESPTPNDPLNLSKETPPPATPPPSPYSAPGAPPFNPPATPMGAPVSTDVIGQAWDLVKPQIGMWIVALIICGAISGLLNGVSSIVNATAGNDPGAAFYAITLVISLASAIIGLLVNAGLTKMAIHHVRSGQADIAQLFNITDVIVPIIVAGLLMYLAIGVGMVLLIIPGILAFLGLSMAIPLVVDQKVDGIEALKRSWATCQPHWGSLFLLFLVLGLLNLAGFCACFVGLLITSPISQVAIALTYRNLFGIGASESNVAPSVFPPPPIASPSN